MRGSGNELGFFFNFESQKSEYSFFRYFAPSPDSINKVSVGRNSKCSYVVDRNTAAKLC